MGYLCFTDTDDEEFNHSCRGDISLYEIASYNKHKKTLNDTHKSANPTLRNLCIERRRIPKYNRGYSIYQWYRIVDNLGVVAGRSFIMSLTGWKDFCNKSRRRRPDFRKKKMRVFSEMYK